MKVSGGNSIFNMYGGKITGNRNDAGKEDAYGGGVRVTYGSTFNMYGGEISGNQSISDWYSYGGGVYVDYRNSIFNMYGGAITGNTAKTGGGIAVRDNATVTIGVHRSLEITQVLVLLFRPRIFTLQAVVSIQMA